MYKLVVSNLAKNPFWSTREATAGYLQAIRRELVCDHRSHEILRILLAAPAPSRLAQPFARLMLRAGIELLPQWACEMFGISMSPAQRWLIRHQVRATAGVLRWAVRNRSVHRARRRMGLPPR